QAALSSAAGRTIGTGNDGTQEGITASFGRNSLFFSWRIRAGSFAFGPALAGCGGFGRSFRVLRSRWRERSHCLRRFLGCRRGGFLRALFRLRRDRSNRDFGGWLLLWGLGGHSWSSR